MAVDESLTTSLAPTRGGRKTLPFIIASLVGAGVGGYTLSSNLGVYLINQYNIQPVDSTLISNIVSGSTNFAPFVGAIVTDTCLAVGAFTVISAASLISSLGMLLLTLTAALAFLRPPPCSSGVCEAPIMWQLAVLYAAIALMTVGLGGTRLPAATMGAAQFDNTGDRETVFSWYAVGVYISSLIAITAVVYIQDNVGWDWGFGLCLAFSIGGLVIFLLGNRYYRHPKPQKKRFVDILCGIISPAKKKMESSENLWYYNKLEDGATKSQTSIACSSSANGEAMEQVEQADLRTLLRFVPLISTGLLRALCFAIQLNMFFLQTLVMDRHLGPHFSIPVASLGIFVLAAGALSVPFLDHVIFPAWASVAGGPPMPLQRIGFGLFVSSLSMVYGGVAESKRLAALLSSAEPISVLWLVPCLILVGLGEAMCFTGQLAFFYQEFPDSLKSSAVSVGDLQSGIANYMSLAVLALLKSAGWLQDDGNQSRIDDVYWMLVVIAMLNIGCFTLCARFYTKGKGAES